jgi:two-component system chemotaxis response regulator CheB
VIGVVIGGSAGAIDALQHLLPELPRSPAAFAVVLHLSPSHPSLLADVLGSYTPMPVREAVDKLPLGPGELVVAPPDYHMLVERDFTVALSRDAPLSFSRPAIDPLFESAAHAFGRRTIAVLLSGGNNDGAAGLRAVRAAGGRVAIQDPGTSSNPQMPLAGITACVPDVTLAPSILGRWLARAIEEI